VFLIGINLRCIKFSRVRCKWQGDARITASQNGISAVQEVSDWLSRGAAAVPDANAQQHADAHQSTAALVACGQLRSGSSATTL
jgi:hypothetical protein